MSFIELDAGDARSPRLPARSPAAHHPGTPATPEAVIETRLERPETGSRTIVLLCYLGYLLSFGDRVIFGLVLKPIKASLGFTDSQLGLLAGAAFAVTYAVCSPLSGLLVDRLNRKTLLVVAIGFWSATPIAIISP